RRVVELLQHLVQGQDQPFGGAALVLRPAEIIEVAARAKGSTLGAEDDHADILRLENAGDGGAQGSGRLEVENIAALGPVQPDLRNAIAHGQYDRLAHGSSLYPVIAPGRRQSLRRRPSRRSSTVRAHSSTLLPGPKMAATPCW